MRYIWTVTVTADDGDNWYTYHVEAKDDVEAREIGVALAIDDIEGKPQIEYAETSLSLTLDN